MGNLTEFHNLSDIGFSEISLEEREKLKYKQIKNSKFRYEDLPKHLQRLVDKFEKN